jgi:hypothetical protein
MRSPEAKPHRKEATMIAKKNNIKKMLLVPLLTEISAVYQIKSSQWRILSGK